MICQFSSGSGADVSTAGSQVTFNTAALNGGSKFALINTEYSTCFSTTFDICKKGDSATESVITLDELSYLMKWLTVNRFKKFVLIDKYNADYSEICYYGSFTAQKIEIGGAIVGLELTFTSNAPYGFGMPVTDSGSGTKTNWSFSVTPQGDEVGYIYPDSLTFKVSTAGNLTISNSNDSKIVYIANCTAGETITMDCQNKIISTTVSGHKIYNDFNFIFFRLVNSFGDGNENTISVSLPGALEYTYTPVRKVVF